MFTMPLSCPVTNPQPAGSCGLLCVVPGDGAAAAVGASVKPGRGGSKEAGQGDGGR